MTEKIFDLVLTKGSVLLSEGVQRPYVHKWASVDIGIKDGKIKEIGPKLADQAEEVLSVEHLAVLPGVIDSQVHFREPGHPHKEDLESGSLAAILGGVTTFFDMPNTSPSTTSTEQFKEKVKRAQGRSWANFAFFIGACEENIPLLGELERLPHCAGVKIFMGSSTGSLLMDNDESLERAARSGLRRMAIHSEDEALLVKAHKKIFAGTGPFSPTLHPEWRSVEVALSSTRRIVQIARITGRPLHMLHMTTAEELEFLRDHRDICTLEVTPQHLTLESPDCYERMGTLAQMNPPIREKRHQDALWRAVEEGLIDVLGSDHAPHTREEKSSPYPKSPSGMPGVQTLLPVMLNHVHHGRLTLERLVELSCLEPARIYHLFEKGRITSGYDADLVVVDLKKKWVVRHEDMASRVGWTPFDGLEVTGSPQFTIVQGKVVTEDRKLRENAQPAGQAVNFFI